MSARLGPQVDGRHEASSPRRSGKASAGGIACGLAGREAIRVPAQGPEGQFNVISTASIKLYRSMLMMILAPLHGDGRGRQARSRPSSVLMLLRCAAQQDSTCAAPSPSPCPSFGW